MALFVNIVNDYCVSSPLFSAALVNEDQKGTLGRNGLIIVNNETTRKRNRCVKGIRIRSFSGPYFPAIGLNTESYSVSLRIQSEYGKMRTRKTPNTDNFHAVNML